MPIKNNNHLLIIIIHLNKPIKRSITLYNHKNIMKNIMTNLKILKIASLKNQNQINMVYRIARDLILDKRKIHIKMIVMTYI